MTVQLINMPEGIRRLEQQLDTAHRAALGRVLAEVQAKEARDTGYLAGSYEVVVSGDSGGVRSNAAYAGPVERGAWVRGRGPHISRSRANHVLRTAGDHWLDYMTEELRGQ